MNPSLVGSDLCVPCGLCCDGSLFERANLRPGEQSFTAELGLEVLNASSQKPGFHLPCPLFKGCCSIYDQPRPHICGAFKCKLLIACENNRFELSDGLEIIKKVRAMQAELSRLLPTSVDGIPSLHEIKRQMQALASQEERRIHLSFLVLAAKYEMLLRKHFLLQFSKKNLPNTLPEMDG